MIVLGVAYVLAALLALWLAGLIVRDVIRGESLAESIFFIVFELVLAGISGIVGAAMISFCDVP